MDATHEIGCNRSGIQDMGRKALCPGRDLVAQTPVRDSYLAISLGIVYTYLVP